MAPIVHEIKNIQTLNNSPEDDLAAEFQICDKKTILELHFWV